ncbi:acyltransferase [Lachnospiraceae bacterium 45-P1]
MNKKRLLQTIGLALKPGAGQRGEYLRKKHILASVGESVHFQPRLVPLYPELIKLHSNIMVSAKVRFITHDASFVVLNKLGKGKFPEKIGCIEVMDNVYIGYNATIMPNVKIGENVIIGAGALVAKDLEPNGVYVGIPAKRICSFDNYISRNCECANNPGGGYSYPYVQHNQNISEVEIERAWRMFEAGRAIEAAIKKR